MAPATTAVTRRRKPDAPERPQRVGGIRSWVRQFLTHKNQTAVQSERQKSVRDRCMTEAEENVAADDKGTHFLEFDPPVDYGDPGEVCIGIKRERRVATVLDAD